jgi:predicted phage-related endonuclease
VAEHELDLEIRKGNWGTSDLGAFHGVDPYHSIHDMWVRDIEGVVFPPTKQMQYGKIFEEPILYVARLETGRAFRPSFNKTYRHPEYPRYRCIASPDGLWPEDDENCGGVEIKNLNPHQLHQYGPTENDLPPRVELQVRGNMAVMQKPRWNVAVWCGDRLLYYTIERDLEFETYILEHAEQQFKRYFDARVRPPIDGSRSSSEWLQRKWPTHRRPDLRPATDDEIEQLRRYGRLSAELKRLEAERKLLANQIKDAVKDREGLVWDGGRFTWRRTKDSHEIDWHGLAETLMTRYMRLEDGSARDKKAIEELIELHTSLKAGKRRIWFKSDECLDAEEEAADAA